MSAAYTMPALVAEPFAQSAAKQQDMQQHLSSSGTLRAEHGDVEAWLQVECRELMRLMFQEHLDLRAVAERRVEARGSDGVERTQTRQKGRGLETVFGDVGPCRMLYEKPGYTSLAPLDAQLNLPPDHFSHGVRRMVAREVGRASYDEVGELIRDYSGAAIAKRQIERLAVVAAQDFDAFYELHRLERETTQELLVISTDAKGIVMLHKDLREATRLAADKSTSKLATRLTPGEKKNRKRMAQVAAVYTVAPWVRTVADILPTLRDDEAETKRPEVRNKRVWASVEKSPRKVIREAFEEAARRDPEQRRRWVVLVDGQLTQLRHVKAEARRAGVKVTILLDIVHVIEKLWKAARALFGESTPEAEQWVSHRMLALLTGRSGGDVARTIRWWAQRRDGELSDANRKAIDKVCGYLANRSLTRLMKYADALRDGLPIATGVIEGACRYLVKDRMDRTGARWSLVGAEAVLRLRALRTTGDFDRYWRFHLAQEHQRNHASRYADGRIPDALPARKPLLRRVK